MNLRVAFLTALVAMTAFAGLAPQAGAQLAHCGTAETTCRTTTEVRVTAPSAPIKPLGPFTIVPVTVVYGYQSTATAAIASTPITLTISSQPPWAIATLSQSVVYASVTQTEASQEFRYRELPTTLQVSTTADAPAFQQGNIEITATAAANGALLGSEGKAQVPIQADYFSIIEASVPTTIQKAKPQAQVVYPITVTNFGNQLTKVEFIVESAPEKWQVTPPSPITLESRQAGGKQTAKTANLVVQTPFWNGYLNVVGAITIRLNSWYALDPKVVGDRTIVSTLTTTKGFYVPGFEPLVALAAIGAAAAALGARRPDR